MPRTVSTDGAPPEEQAYSHSTVANGFVFTAGQIPVTPDGDPVEGSVADKTHQIMSNLESILAEAGTGFENVVRTTAYFTDVDDFAEMDEAYREYFADGAYPARDVVEVAALPDGAEMELVMTAVLED
jgi:2-iminobutanoate/2-iminopropanoate deaminase